MPPNGGVSGAREPPGGSGGQGSRCMRATPSRALGPVGGLAAAVAQQRAVLVEVGGDQPAQGGGAAPVVGAGLVAVAVLAAAGAAAAAVGVEVVEVLGGSAGGAAPAWGLAGRASVGTLVAHLEGSFQVLAPGAGSAAPGP